MGVGVRVASSLRFSQVLFNEESRLACLDLFADVVGEHS